MARASGYTCDQCGKFEAAKEVAGNKEVAPGWMILVIPSPGHDKHDNSFDLCGDKCVRDFATRRLKDRGGTTSNRQSQRLKNAELGDKFDRATRMNHTRHHTNKGVVNPDCPVCQYETMPKESQDE